MHARFWFPGADILNNQLKQNNTRIRMGGRIAWERRENLNLLVVCKLSKRNV